MKIKNIFKARIEPKQAIANLTAKFKQNHSSEPNIEVTPETLPASANEIESKNKIANFVAKLPSFKTNKTAKQELEKDIQKVDRSLVEGANHQKIVAIFRRIATNVKPENIEKIAKNLPKMNRGAVKQVWGQVQSLLATIRDPNIAWKSKTLAIAALIYLVSPLDAIPDVIPGIGLTDDVALILAVVSSLAYEVGNYVEKSANKGVEVASELADIQVKKYNKIIRMGLIGSILAGAIAILVQFIIKQMA